MITEEELSGVKHGCYHVELPKRMADEISEQRKTIQAYKIELEFYADDGNWKTVYNEHNEPTCAYSMDGGARARKALGE